MTNMASEKADVAQISCVLVKKYFLDDEKSREGLSENDYEQLK